jgi:hypothetical protein
MFVEVSEGERVEVKEEETEDVSGSKHDYADFFKSKEVN